MIFVDWWVNPGSGGAAPGRIRLEIDVRREEMNPVRRERIYDGSEK